MHQHTRILASILLILTIITGVVYLATHNTKPPGDNKLHVVASYYPLYDFAKNVGGNAVVVTNSTPAGSEPHDYEPTPRTLASISRSDIFIYNGGNLEPWVDDFLKDYTGMPIKASQNISLQGSRDPHFWLDPVLAREIVVAIRDGFIKADPANQTLYRANADRYLGKLTQLDIAFHSGLENCKTRTVITSHDAFSYLAQRYSLTVASIAGLSPEEEPSVAKLVELSKKVKHEGIKYIFFESLVSSRLADTIARETNAKTLVFDPIEGLRDADQKQGKDYLSVQRQNLKNLRTALECR